MHPIPRSSLFHGLLLGSLLVLMVAPASAQDFDPFEGFEPPAEPESFFYHALRLAEAIEQNDTTFLQTYLHHVCFLHYEQWVRIEDEGVPATLCPPRPRGAPLAMVFGQLIGGGAGEASGVGFSTRVLHATASLLAERFREALVEHFFARLETYLDTSDVGQLFPETHRTVRAVNDLAFPAIGPVFKAAVEMDVYNLFPNAVVLLEQTLPDSVKAHETYRLLKSSMRVVSYAQQGEHLASIIPLLSTEFNDLTYDFDKGVQLVQLFSGALRDTTAGSLWIHPRTLTRLNTDLRRRVFFGLVDYSGVRAGEQQEQDGLWGALGIERDLLRTHMRTLSVLTDELATLLESVQQQTERLRRLRESGTQPDATLYFDFVETTLDAIDFGYKLRYFDDLAAYHNAALVRIWLPAAQEIPRIYEAVAGRKYGAAALKTWTVLRTLLPEPALEHKASWLDDRRFGFYLNFFINVATADDVTSTRQALESAILPSGSWRAKRETTWMIGLGAYVGGTSGYERVDAAGKEDDGLHLGFTAPIGLELSAGTGGTFSLMASFLDLGALVNFHLSSDSVEAAPEVGFQQVLAPGVLASYGFKGVPLILGAGLQYSPRLRTVGEVREANAARLLFFLAVDIPLFRFGGGSRRR